MASLTKETMTRRNRRDKKLLELRQKKEKTRLRRFQADNKEVLGLLGISAGKSA